MIDPGAGSLFGTTEDDPALRVGGAPGDAQRHIGPPQGGDRMAEDGPVVAVPAPREPDYDSVVVAGNGVGALTFAARLARSPDYAGRVVIVAPPISETRRLVSGISLRVRAADYIADALGVGRCELLRAIHDQDTAMPGVRGQISALAASDDRDAWHFSRIGRRPAGCGSGDEPLGYGLRNSRIVAGIWKLADRLGIRHLATTAESASHMRSLAPGSRPLLVNASADSRLLGATPLRSDRMVLASQIPFREMPHGVVHPLEKGQVFTPLIRRDGLIDSGYFTPFSDPLSPQSTWYGLFSRVVPADSAFDPQWELEILTEELFGIGASLGLLPDDPAETLGCALVPAAPEWGSIRSAPGCLELRRAYFAGSPWFYADGMTSPAAAGLLAARAILAGVDPDKVVRRALRALRWRNQLWWLETSRVPLLRDRLVRLGGRFADAHPHGARATWRPLRRSVMDKVVAP